MKKEELVEELKSYHCLLQELVDQNKLHSTALRNKGLKADADFYLGYALGIDKARKELINLMTEALKK